MQLTTRVRNTQVRALTVAFADRLAIVGAAILIDVSTGTEGAIDVAPHLAAMARCETLDPGDAQDIVDWCRALDAIEDESRVVETELGLARGGLGAHVAGLV